MKTLNNPYGFCWWFRAELKQIRLYIQKVWVWSFDRNKNKVIKASIGKIIFEYIP